MSRLVDATENRLQPLIPSAPPQIFRRSQPTRKDGASREDHQGQGHDCGRFMNMGLHMLVCPTFAVKNQEELAEHVERRQSYGQPTHKPELSRAAWAAVGLP